jgi:subtilisin family serine protease
MAKQKYIVLRSETPSTTDGLGPEKSWDWSAETLAPTAKAQRQLSAARRKGVAPDLKVEHHKLDAKQVRELARERDVASISPVMPTKLVKPFTGRARGSAAEAWGIAAVLADTTPWTGEGVTVAVLDTGIDAKHPAFKGITIKQKDFTGTGNGDRNGHGTHCAGTICGRDVAGKRIGIARGVKRVLVGKVLDDDGSGDTGMIIDAINWAVREGAQVISMSLGFDFPGLVRQWTDRKWPVELATSTALELYRANLRAFDSLMDFVRANEALSNGTVIVAASGNESKADKKPDYKIAASIPAAAFGIISVGALAQDKDRFRVAPFSNIFPQISAPGVEILSARTGGGLESMSGTSMACPHVAGIAALWWQKIIEEARVSPKAAAVVDRLRGEARTDVFARGSAMADYGAGMATAPQ